jgi:hypothetical protein
MFYRFYLCAPHRTTFHFYASELNHNCPINDNQEVPMKKSNFNVAASLIYC